MGEDTIKKSVDVPEKDKKFIENEINNFSAEVRRFVGLEKIARSEEHDFEKIQEDIKQVQKIGKEVRDTWREKQEELLEEYNAEIKHEGRQGISFAMEDGSRFTVDWGGEEVLRGGRDVEKTDEAKELGQKLASQWHDAIVDWQDSIDEETQFSHYASDADRVKFSGQHEDISIWCTYVAKSSVSLKVDDGDTGRTYRPDLVLGYEPVY